MWKNRICYLLALLALASLVWVFGKPFLLCVFVLAAGLPPALWLLLRKDAASLRLSLSVQPGGREGEPLTICLKVSSPRVLHAARSVYLDITMHNRLLGETKQRDMVLSLAGSENRYTYTAKPPCCGEVVISCEDAGLCDLLHLFRRKLRPFREVRTVIYPRPLELDVTLSRDAVGETGDNGLTRNRKGMDQSEMFDIRNYVPGDDIRSIHWKLSGKTDELIVRQASDRTHYDLIVLPDFGRKTGSRDVTRRELTTCVALMVELCRRLARQGVPFCIAMPGPGGGLDLYGFTGVRELEQSIPQWLAFEIPEKSGRFSCLFAMEHLEKRFTRMVTIGAGELAHGLPSLAGDIGLLALTVTKDVTEPRAVLADGVENIEIPADCTNSIRILC